MPLGEDLHGVRRTCGRKTTCAPVSPCAERFSDSSSGTTVTFYDRKHAYDALELWIVRRNEKMLCPDRIGKSSNARGMMKCHVLQ